MKMRKPPPELVTAFEAALPPDPRVERRLMFGSPSAFVGGNMFAGVFQEQVFVRLGEEGRAELMATGEAEPFAPMGHPMTAYTVLPPATLDDAPALRSWLERSLVHAAALPPKQKPAKAGAKPKAKAPAAARPNAKAKAKAKATTKQKPKPRKR